MRLHSLTIDVCSFHSHSVHVSYRIASSLYLFVRSMGPLIVICNNREEIRMVSDKHSFFDSRANLQKSLY